MSASSKIIQAAAGNVAGGAVEPVGIDFDDTNDYLSRSSDLTGNTDSNTFTFSAWVYNVNGGFVYHVNPEPIASRTVYVNISSSADLQFFAQNTSGSTTLFFSCADVIPENTFSHILISVDLSNTANRYVYINDVDKTSSVVWSTYSNNNINFTQPGHGIGGDSLNASFDGRLAGVYLDYTYRDLSVEANRRLFIDENGLYVKPPTSGIISVPMDDVDDPGRNDGTGGDFTLNGVVAQSDRGPNQYNAAASTSASNQYLKLTNNSADSKSFIVSGNITRGTDGKQCWLLTYANSTINYIRISVDGNPTPYMYIQGYNSSGTRILNANGQLTFLPEEGINYFMSIQVSVDLTNASNRKVIINGIDRTSLLTWSTYTNDSIDFSRSDSDYLIANYDNRTDGFYENSIGEVYFDKNYIDLSTDNPFWDSDAGKPKPVRQVLEETGNTPLIAMPMSADNPVNNLGTGGDFTVVNGSLTGVRGPSEDITRTIKTSSNSKYLQRTLSTQIVTKQLTMMCSIWVNTSDNFISIPLILHKSGQNYADTSTQIRIHDNGQARPRFYSGTTFIAGNQYAGDTTFGVFKTAIASIDAENNKCYIWMDGDLVQDTTVTNSSITIDDIRVGWSEYSGSTERRTGNIYVADSYVDLTQESNRNLFVDQLGYPRDLTADIEAGNVPTPQVYLKMKDPSNFGANDGTEGDFSEVGTIDASQDYQA